MKWLTRTIEYSNYRTLLRSVICFLEILRNKTLKFTMAPNKVLSGLYGKEKESYKAKNKSMDMCQST